MTTVGALGRFSSSSLTSIPNRVRPLYRPAAADLSLRALSGSPRCQTVPPSPKIPSPYRLLSPQSFVADFAPLHVAGWRLDHLSASPPAVSPPHPPPDLQDRRLVRSYRFEATRDAWRELMQLAANIGEHAEAEDHHPSIVISPAQDYVPTSPEFEPGGAGYVLEVATHTHTPMPPVGASKGGPKVRPGVTTKDIRLATKIEESYGT